MLYLCIVFMMAHETILYICYIKHFGHSDILKNVYVTIVFNSIKNEFKVSSDCYKYSFQFY